MRQNFTNDSKRKAMNMSGKEPNTNETTITAFNDMQIKNMIYTVRSRQVMLDSDLAKLYGV